MNELYFVVVEIVGHIVIKVYIPPGAHGEEPEILKRMVEVLNKHQAGSLQELIGEFPKNRLTIIALDIQLFAYGYKIKEVPGIHWSDTKGHSIHIVCEGNGT